MVINLGQIEKETLKVFERQDAEENVWLGGRLCDFLFLSDIIRKIK
jgi:hypothetical protein